MLDYDFLLDKGVLVLRPQGPLEAVGFTLLASHMDTYLADHGKLHGVLIHAKAFPGWRDFAAMLAHFRFLKDHIKKIEKVAVVADGGLADVIPAIASHFVHAQVRHFGFTREDEALDWMTHHDEVADEFS